MRIALSSADSLPADGTVGTLVARVWIAGPEPGPAVAVLKQLTGAGVKRIGNMCSLLLSRAFPDSSLKIPYSLDGVCDSG